MKISAWTAGRGVILCALAVAIAGLGHELLAQQAPPPNWAIDVMDQIAFDYQNAFRAWLGQILTVTADLFFWLALIEFVIAGIMYAIATPEARAGTTGRFMIKIMLISFVYLLITESQSWVLPLISSFSEVGEYVTGLTLSPSEIVAFGTELSVKMLKAMGVRQTLMSPMMAVYNALAAFVVFGCYVLIAAQVVLTLVHSYLLLSVGLFFLAFAAFRATVPFAENYIMACIFVGIKLMVLYFLVAVGDALTRSWVAAARQAPSFFDLDTSTIFYIIAGVATFALIAWFLPGKVASQITGGARLGLADAMRRSS